MNRVTFDFETGEVIFDTDGQLILTVGELSKI